MSDYDDWSGEVGASIADTSHAAHKAVPAPTGRCVSKGEALSLFASLRDDVGLEKAVEPVVKTMSAKASASFANK